MTTTQLCEHAEILMKSPGRLKDAIQYFFLALERNPTLSHGIDDLLSKIVLCLENRPNSYTEAVLLSKKVIKIDTSGVTDLDKFFRCLSNMAMVLGEEPSGYEEAKKLYRKCLKIKPNDFCAMNGLGVLLEENPSGYEEAENLYRKSLQIFPDNSDTWINLGFILAKKPSGYEEAEKFLQKTLEIQPLNEHVLNLLEKLKSLKQ